MWELLELVIVDKSVFYATISLLKSKVSNLFISKKLTLTLMGGKSVIGGYKIGLFGEQKVDS